MTQLCLPGNALTPHVLEGARFSAGAIYNGVGTMKDRGGQEVSVPSVYMQEGYLSVSPSDIPAGTWNAIDSGTEFVYRDALHVSAKNIMMGVEMLGLDGTATSDGTATAADIAVGKIAYSKGMKLTGQLTPGVDTSSADATAAQILAGKTAYVKGVKVTGTAGLSLVRLDSIEQTIGNGSIKPISTMIASMKDLHSYTIYKPTGEIIVQFTRKESGTGYMWTVMTGFTISDGYNFPNLTTISNWSGADVQYKYATIGTRFQ
ncbi:hypothetical protein [Paenibacillus sp. Marseille-Q9583]